MATTGSVQPADCSEIILSGNLSLGFAAEVRERLLQALATSATVRIVLRDVTELDLSLVQILCAAHRSAIMAGKVLVLDERLPDQFVKIIEDAGLQGHIGCSSDGRDNCIWHRH